MMRTPPRLAPLFLSLALGLCVLPAAAQQGTAQEAGAAAPPGSAERAKQMADELERERLEKEQADKPKQAPPAEAVQPAPAGVGGR
jgi:hypothetical protein